jgi:hypothetical protein
VQKPALIRAGLTALIIMPWFLMNPGAFLDDTVSYLNNYLGLIIAIMAVAALMDAGTIASTT